MKNCPSVVGAVVEALVDTGARYNVFGKRVIPFTTPTQRIARIKTPFAKNPKHVRFGKLRSEVTDSNGAVKEIELEGLLDPSSDLILLKPDECRLGNAGGICTIGETDIPTKVCDEMHLVQLNVNQEPANKLNNAEVLKRLNVDVNAAPDRPYELLIKDGVQQLHEKLLHPCSTRLMWTLRFIGLTMTEDQVASAVGPCSLCIERNAIRKNIFHPIGGVETIPVRFCQTIACDIGYISPVSVAGHKYISVIRCTSTGFIFCKPIKELREATAHVMEIVNTVGKNLQSIYTDHGTNYLPLDVMLRDRGITHVKVPVDSDESNGNAEVAIREVKKLLATALKVFRLRRGLWSHLLAAVCTAHNLTVSNGQVPPAFYYYDNFDWKYYLLLPSDICAYVTQKKMLSTTFKTQRRKFVGYVSSKVCDVLHYNECTDKLALQEVHVRNLHAFPRGEKQDRDVELFENTEAELRSDDAPEDEETGMVMSVQRADEDELDVVAAISSMKARTGTKEEVDLGLFQSAVDEEMQKLKEYEVLEEGNPGNNRVIPTTWVYTWKEEDGNYKPKARIAVRGDLTNKTDELFTPLPSANIRRLMMLVGLHFETNMAVVDVKSAFLNVPLPEEVYIKIFGKVFKLRKALYGLRNAPKLFIEYLCDLLTKRGYTCLSPGVFVKDNSYLLSYVDDILVMSKNLHQAVKELQEIIRCGDACPVTAKDWTRYVGWDLQLHSSKAMSLSMTSFLRSLDDYQVRGVLTARDFQQGMVEDQSLKPTQLSLLGKVGWLSTLYPSMGFAFSHLASQPPSGKLVKTLEKILRDAKHGRLQHLQLCAAKEYQLILWVDASYNNQTNQARLGMIVQLVPEGTEVDEHTNVVFHKSIKDKRLHRSTLSAELSAACEGVSIMETLRKILVLLPISRRIIKSDSRTLVEALKSKRCKDGYSVGRLEYLLQCMADSSIEIQWCPTTEQRADRLTKFIPME